MRDKLVELLPKVYRYALHLCGNRHLAEDLAQDAMVRAIASCSKLTDQRALKVWVFRIAYNLWIDDCRRRRKTSDTGQCAIDLLESGERSAPDNFEMLDLISFAMHAMRQLPERQRATLHLVAIEQLSIAEAAQVLGISTDAIKASLSLARSHMREILKKAR